MSCPSVSQSSSKTVLNCLWNTGGVCANLVFVCGAFTDGRYRPGRAQRGFVEALCRKKNQRVNMGWWAKKWSLPGFFFFWLAFHLLFLTVFLLTRAFVAERWERRFNVCEELALRARCSPHERISPFPWFPLISPCLLTSSDLWSACTSSLEKAKDLKLAVLDVAGWRCRKKKKKNQIEYQEAGWETPEERGEKKGMETEWEEAVLFSSLLIWMCGKKKVLEKDLGTQQTKAKPLLLGLKVRL